MNLGYCVIRVVVKPCGCEQVDRNGFLESREGELGKMGKPLDEDDFWKNPHGLFGKSFFTWKEKIKKKRGGQSTSL